MDIATNLTDLVNDLRKGRTNLIAKGVDVSNTAGFSEVMDKILEVQSTVSTGTVIDDSISAIKQVPVNSISHCYVKSLGGMTTKDEETNTLIDNKATAIKAYGANLIPFPYAIGGVGFTQTKGGITFTVNEDRSFTLKGTAAGTPAFSFASKLDLPSDVDYYLSGNCIGGEWVSGVSIYNQNYSSATNTTPTVKFPKGKKFAWISVQILNGTTVDATFKPMLSRAQALPYTDYHEPATYLIPEALQGTGKGVEGASDTVDFEDGKKITKVNTIALGSKSWQLGSYNADTGIASTYTYSVNDYDVALRSQSLCSHLSFTAIQHNKLGIYIGDTANNLKRTVRVNVLADVVGLTADEYTDTAVIRDKIVQWLKENDVTLTYALAEPTETDIDTFAFDPLIKVEGGGSLEIITDNGGVIPNTIIYQTIV